MKHLTVISVFFLVLLSAASFKGNAESDYFFQLEQNYEKVLITKVISTDAFMLEGGEKIRLIGIKGTNAPLRSKKEKARDKYGFRIEEDNPADTLEEQAFYFVKHMLLDKFVRLEFDSQKKDNDFTTLAYAFLIDDGTFVNLEILKQGYASLSIQPPNTKYADKLRNAYREARSEKRGLQGDY